MDRMTLGKTMWMKQNPKSNKLIIKQLNGILLARFNQIKLKRFQSISHGYTLLIQKNM